MKYLRMLLCELGYPQEEPTLIWEDNKACILLAETRAHRQGDANILIRRFVAEAMSDGVVKIRYTPSAYYLVGHPHKTSDRSSVSEDDRNVSGIKR